MLDLLEPDNLVPDEQKTLRRMIRRGDELREVYQKIFNPSYVKEHHNSNGKVFLPYRQGWPSAYTQQEFNHQLDMERVRLLQAIVGSATIVAGIAPKRRDALRELPDLLDQFGKQAKALAETLGKINEKALRGDLSLPGWFAHDIKDLIHVASWVSGPNSYDSIARKNIDASMVRYSSHVPDIKAMIEALGSVDRSQMQETESRYFEFKRQANPIGDYGRTLLNELAIYWHSAIFLNQFEFTANELLQLAVVCLDLDYEELPDGAERRMREILRESGELDP
jgi:hypothetical protein